MAELHEGGNANIQADSGDYAFRRSSWSMNGGHCIEVACARRYILVRDSKAVAGPRLKLATEAWESFIEYVKDSL